MTLLISSKMFDHFPLFHKTLHHIELCNRVISYIQRNSPKLFLTVYIVRDPQRRHRDWPSFTVRTWSGSHLLRSEGCPAYPGPSSYLHTVQFMYGSSCNAFFFCPIRSSSLSLSCHPPLFSVLFSLPLFLFLVIPPCFLSATVYVK